ncbi:YdcF family protein [Glycomyces sp. NPDC048151]|uniref:YdcF family protein n=1 Tax=Glycomyces sp. NPDC048151 TaxID=3364002 RepID=UPI003719F3D0
MTEDPTRPGDDTKVWQAAETVWDYHQLGHEPIAAEVIIALGCHDIGVADVAADLYAQGLAPLIVATGGDHPATRAYLGDGEARAYRARMIVRGIPAEAILTEEDARHTGENVTNSRDLLAAEGIKPAQILVACMPYMERRAFATCRSQWPEVDLTCISSRASLSDYLDLMWRRDAIPAAEIIANTVGDLDRVFRYPTLGYAIEQPQTPELRHAFDTLVAAGYGTKLLRT